MKFGVLYAFRNPPQWHQPYPDFYRAQFDQIRAVEHARRYRSSAKRRKERNATVRWRGVESGNSAPTRKVITFVPGTNQVGLMESAYSRHPR